MSLRRTVGFYLIAIHLWLAAPAFWLWRERSAWLLAIEGALLISLAIGALVFRRIFGPLDLIRSGIQFLKDSDFNSRFRLTGQRELDELTEVYNGMADHLRQERLRVQEQGHLLDEIIGASPAGILLFDYDGKISTLNSSAARMLGLREDKAIGTTAAQSGSSLLRSTEQLESGGSAILPEDAGRRVKCHASEFRDKGFVRRFLIFEELTEELRATERSAYEKIIRLMSHEINNSIAASNSLLQSCLAYRNQLRTEDREDFESALRIASDRADHLCAFVRAYANVVRLPKPQPRAHNLNELLTDVARLMQKNVEEAGARLESEFDDGVGIVLLDRHQMEQVLVNIVRNAIEAVDRGGVVKLRTGWDAERRIVVCENTGEPIQPDVRANLFTPFFSTKEKGQGIGLTLVQEILRQHGFEFALDSSRGRTRFTIWLR